MCQVTKSWNTAAATNAMDTATAGLRAACWSDLEEDTLKHKKYHTQPRISLSSDHASILWTEVTVGKSYHYSWGQSCCDEYIVVIILARGVLLLLQVVDNVVVLVVAAAAACSGGSGGRGGRC